MWLFVRVVFTIGGTCPGGIVQWVFVWGISYRLYLQFRKIVNPRGQNFKNVKSLQVWYHMKPYGLYFHKIIFI